MNEKFNAGITFEYGSVFYFSNVDVSWTGNDND